LDIYLLLSVSLIYIFANFPSSGAVRQYRLPCWKTRDVSSLVKKKVNKWTN